MAYRQPSFMVSNIMPADRDVGDIVTSATMTDANKAKIIDRRQGSLASFSNSSAAHEVRLQQGGFYSFTQLVIPAGHNLSGIDLQVHTDNDPAFATPNLRDDWTIPANAEVIDRDIGSGAEEANTRVTFDGTGQWEFGEIWFGLKRTLSALAWVDPKFDADYFAEVNEVAYASGITRSALGPPRRRFSLIVRNIDPGSNDHTYLVEVLENGLASPFWYWPPDTSDDDYGPFLVYLTKGSRRQESKAPNVQPLYEYKLDMEETLL